MSWDEREHSVSGTINQFWLKFSQIDTVEALMRCVQGGKKCKINKRAYTSIWQSGVNQSSVVKLLFLMKISFFKWKRPCHWLKSDVQGPIQHHIKSLIIRSCEVLKSRDLVMLTFPITLKFDRHLSSSVAELPVKFPEWYEHYNIQSRDYETSRDFAVRHFIA